MPVLQGIRAHRVSIACSLTTVHPQVLTVSESESLEPRTSHDSVPLAGADEIAQRLESRAAPEREGLPRNYRMRADAHYVEQLGSPAQPVVRLIGTRQIDCVNPPPADGLEPLTKSIVAHGMLQPLIVRRQAGRYTLIAGRKRFVAAMAANLTAVPCLLHEAEGAGAVAIAEADNLRIDDQPAAVEADRNVSADLLQALTADLDTIQTSLSLLRAPGRSGLPRQVGTDLVAAQSQRAAWLIGCIRGVFDDTRTLPLGVILQRVSDQFAAHARLMGLRIECSVSAGAAVWKLPEDSAQAAITGAIFATLAYLDDAVEPRIEVNADAQHGRVLKIEVIQRDVRVPAADAARIASDEHVQSDQLIPALALRKARALAAPYGGSAEFMPLPGIGSVLKITFVSPQPTA